MLKECPSYPGFSVSEDGLDFTHASGRRVKILLGRKGRRFVRVNMKVWDSERRKQKSPPLHIAARLVADAWHGPCPPGMECCHKNDVCDDDRAENLYYGTGEQNRRDAERNGRICKTISRETATQIHARWVAGETQRELARDAGVSQGTISRALSRYGLTQRRYPTAAVVVTCEEGITPANH